MSSAQHRSESAARSTPTRSAAKGHAQKSKIIFRLNIPKKQREINH
ncbi:MAG: hypothetical protein NZ455_06935 [Bacteroidia bacterium]|nr:hypothetical protein [Bacteroidia bacterium]MDW8345852.1 hypothetical protein [Bacteroidia bacterium]